jgi:hypothetical protein
MLHLESTTPAQTGKNGESVTPRGRSHSLPSRRAPRGEERRSLSLGRARSASRRSRSFRFKEDEEIKKSAPPEASKRRRFLGRFFAKAPNMEEEEEEDDATTRSRSRSPTPSTGEDTSPDKNVVIVPSEVSTNDDCNTKRKASKTVACCSLYLFYALE